jgi:hypothetical protein
VTPLPLGPLAAGTIHTASGPALLKRQQTRGARRLFIGNLPCGFGLTPQLLIEFLNATCLGLGIPTHVPIFTSTYAADAKFCFVEFRAVKDCDACLHLLEGLSLGSNSLRVSRPKDYAEPPEDLRDFELPIDMELTMMAARQGVSLTPAPVLPAIGVTPGEEPRSRVVRLANMVTAAELADEEEYEDIVADVEEECGKYGALERITIPKPTADGTGPNDSAVGLVFLLYADLEGATKAQGALHARIFGGKTTQASFFDEGRFERGELT